MNMIMYCHPLPMASDCHVHDMYCTYICFSYLNNMVYVYKLSQNANPMESVIPFPTFRFVRSPVSARGTTFAIWRFVMTSMFLLNSSDPIFSVLSAAGWTYPENTERKLISHGRISEKEKLFTIEVQSKWQSPWKWRASFPITKLKGLLSSWYLEVVYNFKIKIRKADAWSLTNLYSTITNFTWERCDFVNQRYFQTLTYLRLRFFSFFSTSILKKLFCQSA